MNANQLMNMIVRMFVRKAMNFGMKAGTDALNRRDTAGRSQPQQHRDGASPAPKFDAKQARQVTRMARKIGRF
ncbi:hypothetical protein [Shimia sediminis]|uniref:hypothetical protein n=1 Tax=Shimia sediminis TaxID=2497945 RepID=UPI000F8EDA7D|nr:hypothetical protein [Shimia sediminis]